VTSIMRLH